MSHPYRDPRHQPTSGHYPTSANVPRQSEQHGLPFSTTQDPYSNHTSQHVFPGPTPSEGQQHPQPSGHSGSYPPYAEGPLPFPEPYPESSPPQRVSAGYSTIYGAPPPSQTMHQSTLGPYQQERQLPYDYLSSGGSSDSHRAYTTASSVTSGSVYARSEFQPHPGPSSGYTDVDARAEPQNLNASLYEEGLHGSDPLQKAPGNPPTAGRRPQCRYPSCYNHAFVDPRVNELREWCSDSHMRAAVQMGLEKACKQCWVWPRRNGFHYCSGNVCRYRAPGW